MSSKELEPRLAEVMSSISEVEGIIAFSPDGKLISGQTIEEMNKNKIAESSHNLFSKLKEFGVAIGKGDVKEITVDLAEGFAVVAFGTKYSVAAFVDEGSKMQLGLLSRSLRNLLS